MSITTARNFIEKSGCGLVVGIGLAVVIVFSLFSGSMCGSNPIGRMNGQAAEPIPVARVGSQIASLQDVDDFYRGAAAQLLTTEGGADPEREAEVLASALDLTIRTAAQREVAKQRGVTVTAQRIIDSRLKQFDDQIAMQRNLLVQMGQIKPGATEAEAQTALSKSIGQDVAQARATVAKQVEQQLEDPNMRRRLESESVGAVLIENIGGSINLSDEQLKKDLETVVTKRIVLDPMKRKDEDLYALGQKIRSEIEGGMSFEAAMNKYTDDPAPPGKTKGESTVNITRAQISYDDKLKPLADLKPGQMTPVFTLATGETAIYKVIKFDPVVKNFEATKDELRRQRVREMAIKEVQQGIDKLVKENLKWESEGYKLLYDWLEIHRGEEYTKDRAKRLAALKKLTEEGKTIAENPDELGARPATMAYFVALDEVYDAASAAEKENLEEEWLLAAEAVLENSESVALRMEIVRAHLAKKNTQGAADALKVAALANTGTSPETQKRFMEINGLLAQLQSAGAKKEDIDAIAETQKQWKDDAFEALKMDAELNQDYTDVGREKYAEINRKIEQYRTAGIINAAQAAEIEKFQATWRTEKAKADEEAEKERKQVAEDAKKAAEEAKKAADAPKPSTGSGGSPSSTDLGGAGKAGG